jgi:L-serine dehydratase
MNLFDIMGPIMVGPSSSHTAGAVRIGLITRALLEEAPVTAEIFLHGSFAATGRGHGTDRALVAGLLGMQPDNMNIPNSFSLAQAAGLSFNFSDQNIPDAHPNTALLRVTGQSGKQLEVQAASLGGGRIMLDKLDGIPVSCLCQGPTLIIRNQDRPGCVAQVTSLLTQNAVNIATLNLHREKKGGQAVMVIESDQPIPQTALQELHRMDGILRVTYLDTREGE